MNGLRSSHLVVSHLAHHWGWGYGTGRRTSRTWKDELSPLLSPDYHRLSVPGLQRKYLQSGVVLLLGRDNHNGRYRSRKMVQESRFLRATQPPVLQLTHGDYVSQGHLVGPLQVLLYLESVIHGGLEALRHLPDAAGMMMMITERRKASGRGSNG